MVAGMAEAGQSCDEPLHGEEEGRPHQDDFGRDLTHGDQPLADGMMVLVIRMPPRAGWTILLQHIHLIATLEKPTRGKPVREVAFIMCELQRIFFTTYSSS
jgi:hypothetical protein